MKTLLSILCLLVVTLCANAGTYQFNRWTTNLDGTLQNGFTITNLHDPLASLNATVLTVSGTSSNSVQINGTNGAMILGINPTNNAVTIGNGGLQPAGVPRGANWYGGVNVMTNLIINLPGLPIFNNGLISNATNATYSISSTGTTNTMGVNATAILTTTAVSFGLSPATGSTIYTSPVLTTTISIHLQPGWRINAVSGLSGIVIAD